MKPAIIIGWTWPANAFEHRSQSEDPSCPCPSCSRSKGRSCHSNGSLRVYWPCVQHTGLPIRERSLIVVISSAVLCCVCWNVWSSNHRCMFARYVVQDKLCLEICRSVGDVGVTNVR